VTTQSVTIGDIHPLTGSLGAEITGVDLANLDDTQWEHIRELWHEHLVLFFPGQHLDADAHVHFARRFGEPEIHPYIPKLDDDHQEIVVIAGDRGRVDAWHSDVTFSPTPPMASILQMVTCPRRGGDTLWSNQYAAYDTLSAPMRSFIEGLTAVHTAQVFGHPETQAQHPVVRVHPNTGRRALFVNRSFTSHIPELGAQESTALLSLLFAWCEQPNFQCRYHWDERTIALWDNRCTQHYAVRDYDTMRAIQRVTIIGDTPLGPE
jgi:taurine dioxygenase